MFGAHWMRGIGLLGLVILLALPAAAGAQRDSGEEVALAYVWNDTVALADAEGQPLQTTGPSFSYGQGARLFWTANARTLYIARDDGLYATGTLGGAAAKLPGFYSRTLTISQDGELLYYLETVSPQEVENTNGLVAFPLRELPIQQMDGTTGRLAGYLGRYEPQASRADLTFAAALYVRDGGLLGPARPNLWASYGPNLFATCCFPNPGLGVFNVGTGDFTIYDETFPPGAAAINLTRTYLAGPTTTGAIRVYDLITGGQRDYVIEIAGGLGMIERLAWSPDDTSIYILSRYEEEPLVLNQPPPFALDTRIATIRLYRLNLVNGLIRELAWRPDVYGASSMAATDRYVFAVVVDPNTKLVEALNSGQIPPGTTSADPALNAYWPSTHLWRVDVMTGVADDALDNVWGVTARPVR